jgi:hypothetical protein
MHSKARRLALETLKAADVQGAPRELATMAHAYALLELAYQLGRLVDQVPVYGPPDERNR